MARILLRYPTMRFTTFVLALVPVPVVAHADAPEADAPVTASVPDPATPSALPPPTASLEPRLRFGFAPSGTVGRVLDTNAGVDVHVWAPGLTLDLGVQLRDEVAAYLHGQLSYLVTMGQASVYAVGEWTPRRWVSMATGVGFDAMGGGQCIECPGGPRGTWSGISVPLIVALNLGPARPTGSYRHAFRVGVENAVGIEPTTGVFGWRLSLMLGYALM